MKGLRPWIGNTKAQRDAIDADGERFRKRMTYLATTEDELEGEHTIGARDTLKEHGLSRPEQVEAWVRWFLAAREKATARAAIDTATDRRTADEAMQEFEHWLSQTTLAARDAAAVGVDVSKWEPPGARSHTKDGPTGPTVAFAPVK